MSETGGRLSAGILIRGRHPELLRCQARQLLELTLELRLAGEAGLEGDLLDRILRM